MTDSNCPVCLILPLCETKEEIFLVGMGLVIGRVVKSGGDIHKATETLRDDLCAEHVALNERLSVKFDEMRQRGTSDE